MWEDLELDPERIPLFKLIFHILQIVFAFVLWCLEIAVFKNDKAKIVGKNGWTFGVFFLTIPAWIYLGMAPRFPRTRKIALPQVMLAVDAVFTVIWLSAWATQAAYNSDGLCGDACGISKAIVGLGVFVFLFFCITTFFSIWTLKYYQWNNRLPGYDKGQSNSQNIDPDKAAFSLAPHDEEAYAPVNATDHDHDDDNSHAGGPPSYGGGGGRSDYSDPYGYTGASGVAGGSMASRHTYQDNPFRQQDNPFDTDTEYNSGRISAQGGRYGAAPSTVADPYDEDTRPAAFPQANYDHLHR
ncbi:hypothetical protein QBC43DRAFT_49142 [Cladorrhinum sp. PSN259]|nr:hypothetical protein QBC43DRAFT_49142 [Cladorrhinum sp. PSN259]